jgi:predicted MFS family arabinose efflux permease
MTRKEEEKTSQCYKLCRWGAGFLASLLFFVGSFMLFPYVESLLNGVWYFSVMFLAASILMAVRSGMELFSFLSKCHCKSLNCLTVSLTFFGWFLFLIGSILGCPQFDFRNKRD